jgi:RHS repeat-associated protein
MSALVKITNYGNNDVMLPVFQFTASSAKPPVVTDEPGLLTAGRTATGEFNYVQFGATFVPSPSANHLVHNFNLTTLPPSATIDWASAQAPSRPPTIAADAWAAVWANYTAALGSTAGSLQALLQADETYFAQLGTPVTDTATLLDFEMQKASAMGPVPTLGDAVDVAVPEPGLPLTFARTFVQSIPGRYHLGSLGRGWVSNWDVSAFTDAGTGTVIIQQGALSRFFVPQKDGTYQGTGGDHATLTSTGGHYTLRELDGTVTSFLADGRLDSVQDRDGNRITAGYTGALLTSLSHSDGERLTLTYDARGRLSGVTDPVGRTVTYTYDAADEHLTGVSTAAGAYAYAYVTGQGAAREHALASATFPDGSHLGLTYDAQGRLTRLDDGSNPVTFTYLAPGGYTIADGSGAPTTVLVGATGLPVAVKDALGHVGRISYNSDGQPVLATAPDGAAASLTYDSRGNPTGAVDPLGNPMQVTFNPQFDGLQTFQDALGATTSFGYNGQGDLQSIAYADGKGSQLTPGAQGLVSQVVNARGQAAHYVYNSRGQVTEADYADGTTTYTYDAHGNLHTATDAGGTTTMTYDGADRLTRVTYPDGKFLQIGYDPSGRRASTVDQTGFTTNYGYDAAGRLATVKDGNNALIASYTYDAAGRLAERDLGNGAYTVYTYDPNGTVQSVVNHGPRPAPAQAGPVNSRFDYTYDRDGRVLTETTLGGTTTYGYDAAGQLTSVSLPGGRVITYGYDAAGNRTVVSDNGAATTYATNSLDQYTSAGSATFTYDADGNLTVRTGPGGTTTYTYDSRNRLTGVTTPTDTWTYRYDALGNRTSVTHNGQTTQYLADQTGLGTVVGEYDATGALVAHYTEGLGLTSRVDASGNAAYYDFDAQGSTAGLTGAAGSYVATYGYLPFGELSGSTGSVPNPFQYAGQAGVMSDGSGLDFMRARYYSPVDGRFVQRDPIGLAGGANVYEYAGNAPAERVDPSGLVYIDVNVGWGGIIGPVGVTGGVQFAPDGLYPYLGPQLGTPGPGGAITASFQDPTQGWNFGLQGAADGGVIQIGSSIPPTVDNAFVEGGIGTPGASLSAYYVGKRSYQELFDLVGSFVDQILHVRTGNQLQMNLLGSQLYKALGVPAATAGGIKVQAHAMCEEVGPDDPNFIAGPSGSGAQGFVADAGTFPYAVYFENQPTASAPALVVTVTQQLDSHLDWSTFQLGAMGFGNFTVQVPPGLQHYSTRVDATASLGCFVDVTADLNRLTGVVTCTFTTIDPTTLDVPTGDPLAGFLPPDDASQRGEGWVSYTINPLPALPTGTVINAKATVIFDAGLPDQSSLDTAAIFNTIDAGAPTSSVSALPALSPGRFTLSWSGQDDAGGSGIASYDIFVSDNGGPFTPFLQGTTQTSATFTGTPGHTYGFYSAATDNVGNVQPTPSAAQASTTVLPVPTVTSAVLNGDSAALAGAQRSMVDSVVYTFDHAVTLGAGAFTIALHQNVTVNGVTGQTAGTLPALSWGSADGGVTWVVTFSGASVVNGSIADGVYDLTLNHAAVSDAAGQGLAADRTDTFFRVYGDTNGDGTVNNADTFQLRKTFGLSAGQTGYLAYLDATGDGTVNNADVFQFRRRFGTTFSGFTATL